MPRRICRRDVVKSTLIGAAGLATSSRLVEGVSAASLSAPSCMTLGFSTYGMKSLKTEDAISQIQRIGFDAVELTVWPDWDAAPSHMPVSRRQAIRRQLKESPLRLTSLMEHIIPSADNAEHAKHLERLNGVFELAEDLCSAPRPLVQTVLGGGEWPSKRQMLKDRIGDWLELANRHQTVLAIKPHRGGVMSRPEEAVWLIEQLGSPTHLRIVYDYSHYAYRDMTLEGTVKTALPYIAHVAVKDPVRQGDRVVFKLPGEAGTVPYSALLKLLSDGGYRRDISCEVSGMVWNKSGYDPIAAAEQCYATLAKAFVQANVARAARR